METVKCKPCAFFVSKRKNQLSLFDAEEGMEIPVADAEEVPGTAVKEHTRQRNMPPPLMNAHSASRRKNPSS